MKNNCKSKKEDTDSTKKYVFFSDPDVVARRTQRFTTKSQDKQDCKADPEQQNFDTDSTTGRLSNVPVSFDFKGLENLFSYPVQSHPFPFINAVKRKLALNDYTDPYKKTYQPPYILKKEEPIHALGFCQVVQNMNFMQALNVPEHSTREGPVSKLLGTTKSDVPKQPMYDTMDRSSKNFEKVQRKLDFSISNSSSIISSKSVEPLKVPNLSIASNLSRKKEHTKENFREKENRSKKIKRDEASPDINKRSKSPKCISRRDYSDNTSDSSFAKLKNDKSLFHTSRDSDFLPVKPKSKTVVTSATKKDGDKRQRLTNIRSSKGQRDGCLESKLKTYSNESISDQSSDLLEKVSVRELARNMFDNVEHRFKDEYHALPDSRQGKQKKQINQTHGKTLSVPLKDQGKKTQDKVRSSIKLDAKHLVSNTEESEDVESISQSHSSLFSENPSSTTQVPYTKHKEDALPQWSIISMNKEEGSFTQTITPNQTSTENDLTNVNEIPDALLDRRRISFRDETRSPQEEFHDLVTPSMNLVLKSKRRKQFVQNDSEVEDTKNSTKNGSGIKVDMQQETMQVLHPTALHMQFQAELQLLDTVDESFRKVMSVENSLYNAQHDQKKEVASEQKQSEEELQASYPKSAEKSNVNAELLTSMSKLHKQAIDESSPTRIDMRNSAYAFTDQAKISEFNDAETKPNKPTVKAVEVQTQTVNDIATQTDLRQLRHISQFRCPDPCGNAIQRGFTGNNEVPQCSLDSIEHFEDLDQIEDISLPNKLRTMSEISLHETTSSIKTETGTEISISTRDVTCSFNQYLDLEMAQLIKDEKQMYDKIQMLFKSREKSLNDRTKKLFKLEEEKRALKDTGQDSRISSVKKKQRALLLKLQQEKDEMNRLKELHKLASQERKLMLQKQRNMFNPQMSTKNILTKLKRSADCSSPRRLSGPMKGYDIRSNSSMSSLVDSDRSQHERSQADPRLQISDNDIHFSKFEDQEFSASFTEINKSNEPLHDDEMDEKCVHKSPKDGNKSKYELKSNKFEEKMPRTDILRIKAQSDVESKLMAGRTINIPEQYLFEKERHSDSSQLSQLNKSITEQLKSETDIIVEELSRKSKSSQAIDSYFEKVIPSTERSTLSKNMTINTEIIPEDVSLLNEDMTTSKTSQVSEDILQSYSRSSKKSSSKTILSEIQSSSKKSQSVPDSKSTSKRKSPKCPKIKSSSSTPSDNISRSKSEEYLKQHNKHNSIRIEKELTESDYHAEDTILDSTGLNETLFQSISRHSKTVKDKNCRLLTDNDINFEGKENLCKKGLSRNIGSSENYSDSQDKSPESGEKVASKSQVSTVTISRHSSGDSERNYSKSVIVRSQGSEFKTPKKLEQTFNARETAVANRRNRIEGWVAWDAKLRAEEDRVARMEQKALKLVTAPSNVFSQQERRICPLVDTTISSDTSDVEGRIELLTEKLQEQRMEMSRLKREERKQTKQKLRAFEANLLNQIKKYDTTIYEMRKKLESRKGFDTDNEKMTGDLKSWIDFKIPEMPIRRIQDICKSADLLRSRSESDLMSSKKQRRDIARTIGNEIPRQKPHKLESEKYGMSEEVKREERPEPLHIHRTETSHTQSTVDGSISEKIEDENSNVASVLPTMEDIATERHTYSTCEESTSADKITGEIKTDIASARLESEGSTISPSYMSRHTSLDVKPALTKPLHSVVSQDKRDAEYSHTFTEMSDYGSENVNTEIETSSRAEIGSDTRSNSPDLSKNIHYVQWNNEMINKTISSLENDVRALTEMASLLNQNSAQKKALDKVKFSLTSPHESENVLNTVKSNKEEEKSLHKKDFPDFGNSEYVPINETFKSYSDINSDKNSTNNMGSLIPILLPKGDIPIHDTNQDIIDYEAKSKEILNEIEKSIVSEHIKGHDLNSSSGSYENTAFESRTVTSLKNKDFSKTEVNTSKSSYRITPIEEILQHTTNLSDTSNVPSENTFTQELEVSRSKLEILDNFQPEEEKFDDSLDVDEDAKSTNNETPNKQTDVIQIQLGLSDVPVSKKLHEYADASSKEPEFKSLSEKSYSQVSLSEVKKTLSPLGSKISQTGENFNENRKNENDKCVDSSETNLSKWDDTSSYAIINEEAVCTTNGSRLEEGQGDQSVVNDEQWTVSDSFDIQQNVESERSLSHHSNSETNENAVIHDTSKLNDNSNLQQEHENVISDTEDISVFLPKGESTNIDVHGFKFDETLPAKAVDELDDILDVIAKETDKEICQLENVSEAEAKHLQETSPESICANPSVIAKSSENAMILQNVDEYVEKEHIEETAPTDKLETRVSISQSYMVPDDCQSKKNEIDINDNNRRNDTADNTYVVNVEVHAIVEVNQNIVLSTTKSEDVCSIESEGNRTEITLPEVELDAKVELVEDDFEDTNSGLSHNEEPKAAPKLNKQIEMYETVQDYSDTNRDQDSSDGEQLDNLVEVVESKLHTIEKEIEQDNVRAISPIVAENTEKTSELAELREDQLELTRKSESIQQYQQNLLSSKSADMQTRTEIPLTMNEHGCMSKTFEILKDPEYEDISEESLEVSEILEKTEHPKSNIPHETSKALETYQSVPKSEEVLKILDAIALKTMMEPDIHPNKVGVDFVETVEPISSSDQTSNEIITNEQNVTKVELSGVQSRKGVDVESSDLNELPPVEKNRQLETPISTDEDALDVYNKSEEIGRLEEEASDKLDQDTSSDSNEGGDSSRILSEVDSDSPRDANDVKLEIDDSSEKEIAAMISELKASLEQPGLESAEVEAKVLQIQQLEIELEIKALEAKGRMTYYVREIPNKPPPPYTPPGESVRIPLPPASPLPPPTVVPSNVEELTSFVEKATAIIFEAKLTGDDIMSVEPPSEIYKPTKESTEIVSQEKRVYHTFLFDLCKEIIAEVYKTEYEKPGPSWTKPNETTKPTIRFPKTLNELKDYVNKEVATLFGFKPKLQRENMVMQWIRKRRDRVDELLAREAQAEEDEWTKFHHDELTVKNSLTIAILETLTMETVKEVKVAYAKKRKVVV